MGWICISDAAFSASEFGDAQRKGNCAPRKYALWKSGECFGKERQNLNAHRFL